MGLAPTLTCHDDFIPIQQELPGVAVPQLYSPCAFSSSSMQPKLSGSFIARRGRSCLSIYIMVFPPR